MKILAEQLGDVYHRGVEVCAVTKTRSIEEVEDLLARCPFITVIAENRWPDCEDKFKHFVEPEYPNLQRHFIGPLQSNKVRKVLPLVDCVQSVDSLKLMNRISDVAGELGKEIEFYFQVNISKDPLKSGINPDDLAAHIREYLSQKSHGELRCIHLSGLMTIGAQSDPQERAQYYKQFRQLFDQINKEFFPEHPLKNLSMGMSDDFQLAVDHGSTMVRLGRALF